LLNPFYSIKKYVNYQHKINIDDYAKRRDLQTLYVIRCTFCLFVSDIHTYIHIHTHTHTHTHTRSSLIHQTALMANGCETSHLTPSMTNIQSTVNITQFKNHNHVYIQTKFKIAIIINKLMIELYFF